MSAFIPYLVVLGVIVVFFGVCYLVFRDSGKSKEAEALANEKVSDGDYYERKRRDHGAAYYREDAKQNRDNYRFGGGHQVTDTNHQETSDKEMASTFVPLSNRQMESDFNHAMTGPASNRFGGAPEEDLDSRLGQDIVSDLDMTKPMLKIPTEPPAEPLTESELTRRIHHVTPTEATAAEAADDATRIIPVVRDHSSADTFGRAGQSATHAAYGEAEMPDLIALGTSHFMSSFGAVNASTKEQVLDITKTALDRLGITASGELHALLENIVVQEALLCMQKAYATTPTVWMKETAIEAFMDVVQEPKSSTPYLVAFDALRILPHLQLGHFQIMALALLLQYSRNSNNYSLEHLQHYVDKYIEPFLSDLPREESMYRQLDYLRCSIQEPERNTFWDIMVHSYPFVFAYAGFDKDELTRALRGHALDGRYIVKSVNSPLLKLAVVDEGLAPRYFHMAHLDNPEIQQHILALATGKPVDFNATERKQVLEYISPVLPKVADMYDSMPLSHSSLTLLGLYLGRAHVKVTIGEEFDLSPWF